MTPSERDDREERELIVAQLAILESLCTLLQPIEVEAFQPPARVWPNPVDVARKALDKAA